MFVALAGLCAKDDYFLFDRIQQKPIRNLSNMNYKLRFSLNLFLKVTIN